MIKRLLVAAVFISILTSCRSKPPQGAGSEAAQNPNIDPQAMAALKQMGAFLREQQTFAIEARTQTDEVLEYGQKIQIDGTTLLDVQRPDQLHAEVLSDRKLREFFYNGHTFTISAPRTNTFAAVPVDATLDELAQIVADRFKIELPLAELFSWGADPAQLKAIRSAFRVGPATVAGVQTEQYAFRQPGLDWQIWIEQGPQPLPRKLVLTNVVEPTEPQQVIALAWDLDPQFGANTFTFVPDPSSKQISMRQLPQLSASR